MALVESFLNHPEHSIYNYVFAVPLSKVQRLEKLLAIWLPEPVEREETTSNVNIIDNFDGGC